KVAHCVHERIELSEAVGQGALCALDQLPPARDQMFRQPEEQRIGCRAVRRLAGQKRELLRRRVAPRETRIVAALVFLDPRAQLDALARLEGEVEARGDRDARAGLKVHAGTWVGSGVTACRRRSSSARLTSRQTCLCSRQNSVSVEAKSPFSKNLFAGGPPP